MRFHFPFAPLLFVLVAGLGFLPGHAKDKVDRKLKYLTPDQEQAILATLPPPPAPGSAADQADLATVLQDQATRTPAQLRNVMKDAGLSPKLFEEAAGTTFTKDQDPKLFHLFEKTLDETSIVDGDAKHRWNRPRPFQSHPEIHPAYQETGLSYPSGHAMGAYACAIVLGEIFPGKQAALLAEAADIAQSRIMGGVHYPSDREWGEKLGREVAQDLLANPAFEQSVAEVKTEMGATR
jgi:acid phosphatase (class A)